MCVFQCQQYKHQGSSLENVAVNIHVLYNALARHSGIYNTYYYRNSRVFISRTLMDIKIIQIASQTYKYIYILSRYSLFIKLIITIRFQTLFQSPHKVYLDIFV